VTACRKSAIAGKKQGTEIGSFMTVQPSPALAGPVLGFVFNVYATTPTEGSQTLLARWDESRKLGFRIGIDAQSRLEFLLGDGPRPGS
jgi:hypothetical protein